MKKLTIFLLVILTISAKAQIINSKKIKVVLLGTFHYRETSNRNKTKFDDLFSTRSQSE
jgi:hypothetical protein